MSKMGNWNIIRNFFNVKSVLALAALAGLYVIQYMLFFDWDKENLSRLAWIEIGFTGFNIFYLGLMKLQKTFLTYLSFMFFAKIVIIAWGVLGNDLSKIMDAKNGAKSNLDSLSLMISYVANIGIAFVSVLIVPYMFFSYVLNFIDFKVISKMGKNYNKLNLWYFFFTLFEITLFFVCVFFINSYLSDVAEGIWDDLTQNSTVGSSVYARVVKVIYNLMRPVLVIGWLPLLITLNRFRSTHVFNDKGTQIYIALKISLLISYIKMFINYNINKEIPVSFTIIMISIIGAALLLQVYLFFKAMQRNKIDNEEKYYIPHMIKFAPKINKTVKQLRLTNGKFIYLFYEKEE